MRAKLILIALSAAVAFGQDVSRVFHLHHIDKEQDLNEFATMVRAVADIRDASVDAAQKTMSVHGTAVQIAVAEWMFTELDRQSLPEFATKEFKIPNKEDDVARIFFLHNASTIQDFQEVATSIRTVVEIRQIFTFNMQRAFAVRGTSDQIAVTEWLIRELDHPANEKRTDSPVHEIIETNWRPETKIRVFYLPYTTTVQQFQEVATLIRTIAETRRLFTYNESKAVIVRGDADKMALTDWVVHELAKAVTPERVASAAFTYSGDDPYHENIVRVFYVKDVPTAAAFQQVATQIRATTKMRKVFTYNETRALAVRGTAEQVAMAEQMLKDRALQIASK
jgi:hypothetical protein